MPPVSIPAWQRPGFMAGIRRFAEPRLMMTAAMAFFSIALTLNLTGVRLRDLRLSNLRPSVMRSFMERRLTMASTPIIRYYDHSRLAYEVQSTVRQLRLTTQGVYEENRQKAPGESRQTPNEKNSEQRVEPLNQLSTPAVGPAVGPTDEPTLNDADFMESSLGFHARPAHSGGSADEKQERSTVWTA
jgi:hypothetical protein